MSGNRRPWSRHFETYCQLAEVAHIHFIARSLERSPIDSADCRRRCVITLRIMQASKASANPQPGISTSTAISIYSYIWYAIPLLVKSSLFVVGLLRIFSADATLSLWDRTWCVVFASVTGTGAVLSLHLIRATWLRRLTPQQVGKVAWKRSITTWAVHAA